MKEYIKPSVTIVEIEAEPIMAAMSTEVDPTSSNITDRAKENNSSFGFDVWDFDDNE